MSENSTTIGLGPLASLRRFAKRKKAADAEFCELCRARLPVEHQHLLELDGHKIVCACDACSLLFSDQAAPRYHRIPRRVRRLADFALDDQEWANLLIPIELAFLFFSSSAGRVLAYYPSPGGAVESLLDLQDWAAIAERNPVLTRMEPDVEALLVNRVSKPPEYYIVPIDRCYQLVGLIRKNWRGLSGGAEVWKQIEAFFSNLRLNKAAPKAPAREASRA